MKGKPTNTFYQVHAYALESLYQTPTDALMLLLNHNFVNTIHNCNMFQPLC